MVIPGATGNSYPMSNVQPYQAGTYSVIMSNSLGESITCSANLTVQIPPGAVEAWGDDRYGQCDVPVNLTNAIAIAAGRNQSAAVLENGPSFNGGRPMPQYQLG